MFRSWPVAPYTMTRHYVCSVWCNPAVRSTGRGFMVEYAVAASIAVCRRLDRFGNARYLRVPGNRKTLPEHPLSDLRSFDVTSCLVEGDPNAFLSLLLGVCDPLSQILSSNAISRKTADGAAQYRESTNRSGVLPRSCNNVRNSSSACSWHVLQRFHLVATA